MVITLAPLVYGRVIGRFLAIFGDSTDDTDMYPDAVPMTGTITFTARPTSVLITTALPDPATAMPVPVTVTLDSDGYIVRNGIRGVFLVASNDPSVNPTNFTYTASFSNLSANGVSITYPNFDFNVLAGKDNDLTLVSPVSSTSGVVITKGDKGDPNTLTIGNVATGPSGSAASASVRGTSPNQILDLVIPKGDPGIDPAEVLKAQTTIVGINTRTSSYTFVLSDQGKQIEYDSIAPGIFTIPTNSAVPYPIGTVLNVYLLGKGDVTLAGASGVTIQSPVGYRITTQYGSAALIQRALNVWNLAGFTVV